MFAKNGWFWLELFRQKKDHEYGLQGRRENPPKLVILILTYRVNAMILSFFFELMSVFKTKVFRPSQKCFLDWKQIFVLDLLNFCYFSNRFSWKMIFLKKVPESRYAQ
jgi:hypothetical protein